jgi:O-antigen/teichoic acid export membrane protein
MSLRRVLSGAAYLFVASILLRALALISFPILTHFLEPSSYGIAALAMPLVSIMSILGVAGQDTSLMRSYHDGGEFAPNSIVSFFFKLSLITGLISGVLGGLLWLAYLRWSGIATTDMTALLVAAAIALATVASMCQTASRMKGQYGRLSVAIILSGITGLVLSVSCALLWRTDEVALLLAGLAPLVVVLALSTNLPSTQSTNVPWGKVWGLVKVGLPLVTTAVAFWVFASTDRWFLANEISLHDLGVYSVAVTVAMLGQIVTTVLSSVWNPELYRNIQGTEVRNQRVLRQGLTLVIWSVILAWFATGIFGEILLVLLAAPDFRQASHLIPWIALGYMIYGINQFFGFGFMLHRRTSLLGFIWGLGIVVALGLYAVLTPLLHTTGAIIAQVGAFGAVASSTWALSYRWTPFQPHWVPLILSFLLFLTLIVMVPSLVSGLGFGAAVALRSGLFFAAMVVSFALIQPHLDPIRLGPIQLGKKPADNP